MLKRNNIILALMTIVASWSLIPYKRMPKIIQDLSNILSSINPFKHLYDLITSMDEIQAIYDLHQGDHIYCHRPFGYTHHGIYAGNGLVFAYQGNTLQDTHIQKLTINEFACGDRINRLNYTADFDVPTILNRAASRTAEYKYNLITNNCMHYAYWCRLLDQNINTTEQIFNTLESYKEV